MSDDGSRMSSKFEKEAEDLEVALMADSNSDEKKCVYGGFSSEAYEELVRYHRNKEIPKRLQGHLKHRIDCFKRKAKRFQLIEGTDQLIYIGFKPDQSTVGQFVVKKNEVEKILTQAHLESNHGGLNATRKMVSTKFYWNSITSDVEQFIKQCPRCRITRMRYVASNNVPWRKGGRYGDIYTGNWDGSEDDYALSDRSYNRTWKFTRNLNGGEYATYPPDNELNVFPQQWKHDRPANDVMIADEMTNEDIDIENDVDDLAEGRIDTQMLLPHYFRVRPTPPAFNRSHLAEWAEREQVLDYDESFGNPEEAYYEDDFIVGENMTNIAPTTTGEERLVSEDSLDGGVERSNPTKTIAYKEKLLENAPIKRRYVEDGREYIIETDRKYFMVEAEQLLQLFKRCSVCGEKLKQVTLYADSPIPTVAYQCNKCEQTVWFGQKMD
uniref:Integrase_H2C2 domain-containing protein n=1 Tax=Elaeophora elaphi TaxID=1147741 RepID=A0A158Q8Q9_9BILA